MKKYYEKLFSFKPLRLVFMGETPESKPEAVEKKEAAPETDDLLKKGLEQKQKEYNETRDKFTDNLTKMSEDDSKPHLQKLANECLFTLDWVNLLSKAKDLLPDDAEVTEKIGKVGEALKMLNAFADGFKEAASEKTELDKKHAEFKSKRELVEGRVTDAFSRSGLTQEQVLLITGYENSISALDNFDFVEHPSLYDVAATSLSNINSDLQENFKPVLRTEFKNKYFGSEGLKNYKDKVGQHFARLKDDPVIGEMYREAGQSANGLFETYKGSFMEYGLDEAELTNEFNTVVKNLEERVESALTEEVHAHPLMSEIASNESGKFAGLGDEYTTKALDLVEQAKLEGSEFLKTSLDLLKAEYCETIAEKLSLEDIEDMDAFKKAVEEAEKNSKKYTAAVEDYKKAVDADYDSVEAYDAAVKEKADVVGKALGEWTESSAKILVPLFKASIQNDPSATKGDLDATNKKWGESAKSIGKAGQVMLEAGKTYIDKKEAMTKAAEEEASTPDNFAEAEALFKENTGTPDAPEPDALKDVKETYRGELEAIKGSEKSKEEKEVAIDNLMTQYRIETLAKGHENAEHLAKLEGRAQSDLEGAKTMFEGDLADAEKAIKALEGQEGKEDELAKKKLEAAEISNGISRMEFNLNVLNQLKTDAAYPMAKKAAVYARLIDESGDDMAFSKGLRDSLGDEKYAELVQIDGKADGWAEDWDNVEATDMASDEFKAADEKYQAKLLGLAGSELKISGSGPNLRMPGGVQFKEVGDGEAISLALPQDIHYVKSEKGTYVPFVRVQIGEGEDAQYGMVALNLLKKSGKKRPAPGPDDDKEEDEVIPETLELNINALAAQFDEALKGIQSQHEAGLFKGGVEGYAKALRTYEKMEAKVSKLPKGSKIKVDAKYRKFFKSDTPGFSNLPEGESTGAVEITKGNLPALGELFGDNSSFQTCKNILEGRKDFKAGNYNALDAGSVEEYFTKELNGEVTGWSPAVVSTGNKEVLSDTPGKLQDKYKGILEAYKLVSDEGLAEYKRVAGLTFKLEQNPSDYASIAAQITGDDKTHLEAMMTGSEATMEAAGQLQKEISQYKFDEKSPMYDLYQQLSKLLHNAQVFAGKHQELYNVAHGGVPKGVEASKGEKLAKEKVDPEKKAASVEKKESVSAGKVGLDVGDGAWKFLESKGLKEGASPEEVAKAVGIDLSKFKGKHNLELTVKHLSTVGDSEKYQVWVRGSKTDEPAKYDDDIVVLERKVIVVKSDVAPEATEEARSEKDDKIPGAIGVDEGPAEEPGAEKPVDLDEFGSDADPKKEADVPGEMKPTEEKKPVEEPEGSFEAEKQEPAPAEDAETAKTEV
jgi:hypothetical protein